MISAWSHRHLIKVLYIVGRDDLGKTYSNWRKRPIVLLFFLVILSVCLTFVLYVYMFISLTLYLMLNQGVSKINCCLTEYYWIKELDETIS